VSVRARAPLLPPLLAHLPLGSQGAVAACELLHQESLAPQPLLGVTQLVLQHLCVRMCAHMCVCVCVRVCACMPVYLVLQHLRVHMQFSACVHIHRTRGLLLHATRPTLCPPYAHLAMAASCMLLCAGTFYHTTQQQLSHTAVHNPWAHGSPCNSPWAYGSLTCSSWADMSLSSLHRRRCAVACAASRSLLASTHSSLHFSCV